MYETLPEQIKVRINRINNDKCKREYEGHSHIVSLDKGITYTIESLAEYILAKIDPHFDPTETNLDKVKIYSQEGIDLKDSDLFFLENFGTLYLDVHGYPFNYKQILHQYKICEKLGKGRFGVVYKIVDKVTDKAFAMKMIKIEGFFSRANNAEILFKEQKALMQFNHNNVVKLYNGFVIKNKIWQIMELWAGGELKKYLLSKPQQRVSEREARFLILQIWRGISYCHQKGIIHRNLKPENILIAKQVNNQNNPFSMRHSLIIGEVDIEKEDYEDILL